jgi:mono/diheme cytochrome c family protein
MSRRYTRLAIIALTLVALGALAAACAPATMAPTAVPPTVAAQPTKAAADSTSAPAATQVPTAVPAATQVAPTATKAAAAPTATRAAAQSAAVSFAKDVLPIFEQSCVKCHGGDQTKAGLALKTYAQLMKGSENGPVIKTGDAQNSFLVQQINNGKMPQRASKLPQAQIDTITAWVNAGAPNN